MLVTVLIYMVALTALLQPNVARTFAVICFSGLTILHDLIMSGSGGLEYYGTAALLDLAIILVTSGISPIPKMVIHMHFICMVSLMTNFFGWALWFFYLPPTLYDITFLGIYFWALVAFLRRDESDVGDSALDSWGSCFRFSRSTWVSYFNKYSGKI